MTIQLKDTIFIAGVHQASGTQLTLGADMEAELVNRGVAVFVGDDPAAGGLVPLMFDAERQLPVHPATGDDVNFSLNSTALTACAIGDSISARDEGARASGLNGPRADGVQTLAEMLLGGGLEVTGIYATGGYTITQVAMTHLPTALAAGTDVIYVRAGVNDIIGSSATGADAYANLKTLLIDPILAAGKLCVVSTITYSADMTDAMRGEMVIANRLIRALSGTNRRLRVADDNAVMTSTGGVRRTAPSPAYDDNTHQNQAGGYWMATEAIRCYKELGVLEGAGRAQKPVGAYGLITNPRIAGNNASGANKTSLGAGILGTGPNGWTINRSGTTTATVGSVARPDNRDGNALEVAMTVGSAGNVVDILPAAGSGGIWIVGTGALYQRSNSAAYVEGEIRRFSNGRYYRVISAAGSSGASEPATLPTTAGKVVTDGGVVWVCMPDFLADSTWAMRLVSDFMVTAQSGLLSVQAQLRQMEADYTDPSTGVSAYNRSTNAFETLTSSIGTVHGPLSPNLATGFDALPQNKVLTARTPWVRFHAETRIIEPKLRFSGAAGATATLKVLGMEIEIAQV